MTNTIKVGEMNQKNPRMEHRMVLVQQDSRANHPNGIILKTSLATVVYTVWIERNNRIFQSKASTKEILLHLLKLSMSGNFLL